MKTFKKHNCRAIIHPNKNKEYSLALGWSLKEISLRLLFPQVEFKKAHILTNCQISDTSFVPILDYVRVKSKQSIKQTGNLWTWRK